MAKVTLNPIQVEWGGGTMVGRQAGYKTRLTQLNSDLVGLGLWLSLAKNAAIDFDKH